jgi:hypothetical protein
MDRKLLSYAVGIMFRLQLREPRAFIHLSSLALWNCVDIILGNGACGVLHDDENSHSG